MATPSVRLSRRGREEPETGQRTRGSYTAITPEQQLYGIYAPQLAAALAREKKSTAATILDMGTLQAMAGNEAARYEAALAAANAAQKDLQASDAYYGMVESQGKYLQGDVDRGMGGVRKPVAWDEEYKVWKQELDPVILADANNVVLNGEEAERVKTLLDGYGVFAEKTGIIPEIGHISRQIASSADDAPVPLREGFKSPELQVKEYGTDQGLTAEQQMETARVAAAAKANGDDIKVVVTEGAGGVRDVRYEGTPEALAAAGIDPNTGKKLNPNAGANGGAAPATPAAKKPKPQDNKTSVRPVRDARPVAEQLFPGVKVNQTKRDPNSDLGRANPTSWHNRTAAAVDVRPIKGMTFEQYVQKYRNAGYEIIEAQDEVKKPSRHATGPHWHVVLGQQRGPQVYAQRFKADPRVADAQVREDGAVVVTTKSGKKLVYRNGVRIGG